MDSELMDDLKRGYPDMGKALKEVLWSIDRFLQEMKSHGYTVPEMAG
ncbi:MAG: hypothetical protein IJ679_08305 [Lachnospiraceae bacterium]|nr:hypothetical protein [Lachnospiraceae bacterium]